MSFLNDLKRQAASIQTPDASDPEVRDRNARLANGACRVTRDYWKEMADQLNLIRPPSGARYLLDGRHPIEELHCANFRVIPVSRHDHSGEEHFESVVLAWQAVSARRVRIEKDFPNEIERVRAALRQAGIQAHEAPVRNVSTGRTVGTAFDFNAEVAASIRLVPLPETGRVRLIFTNIDQLERVEAEFPAVAMRLQQLDDIGRWIVGQPNRVLEFASDVRRFSP